MPNPLLDLLPLPPFSAIKPEHIEPAVEAILAENRKQIAALLEQDPKQQSWDTLIRPLEELDDRLNQVWSLVSHLNGVASNDALRAVYDACLPKLSSYATEMGQNSKLYNAINALAQNDNFKQLDKAQQKVIENELRDFHLAGVSLPEEDKLRYGEIKQSLSLFTAKFEHNLLDATQAWTKWVRDEKELQGLPEMALAAAKEAADKKGLSDGFLFTLEAPSFLAVMTYADARSLRQEMYTAYVTRSSDQGPFAGQWDNTPIMKEILTARKQLALLLGYSNYAEFSLVPKMAKTTAEVVHFLNALSIASVQKAKEEFEELAQFAKESFDVKQLEAWDVAYYSEKLRELRYDISEEAIRPYFPENQVIEGLFKIVQKLFGVRIEQQLNVDVWHPDVRFYSIFESNGDLQGQFYLDLYARSNKRGGAWMDECRVKRITQKGTHQTPIAFLTCNFNGPIGDQPALFSHDEVITLFHEFGHGLHHLLTKINYAGVSGINGVPWDVVELPSQFLENWCWEKQALHYIAKHYKTGESLPDALYDKMIAAKNFQSAMHMVRQLEFSLFDICLHMGFDENEPNSIQRFLDEARQKVAVVPISKFNRFQNGFSHIFAGGYAAGYYSYKWAEVLSSDAFSKFEETGVFDQATGASFLHHILEKGGSEDPMTLYVAFRGREPNVKALLRHTGIDATQKE